MTIPVAVTAVSPALTERARVLADQISLPLLPAETEPRHCSSYDALLLVAHAGLSLQLTGPRAPGPVAVDFGSPAMRHRRRGGANELLGKAVGVGKKKSLRILDGTAGLGRDSFVLADLGCEVLLCERDPVVGVLLQSGIKRASASDDPWLMNIAQRLCLHEIDARGLPLAELGGIDVIYLDPMFPERNHSAAVKKEMALFQTLLQPADDAGELLTWAKEQDVARVVVKRPLKAPDLAGLPPSHCIRGKAVRYDVYVNRGLG